MTRGSRTDGPWDIDEIVVLPSGQVGHIAQAPQLTPPGAVFRYDNGSAHLISAGLEAVVGRTVAKYAERVLFGPLGIEQHDWLADNAGISFGHAHLKMSAHDLLKLGTLWLNGGAWNGESLVDPRYLGEMTTAQSSGGPPEYLAYGYLTWIGNGHYLASGWAGQHVVVSPRHQAIVVLTGDPQFTFGPPPSDALLPGWMSALNLVNRHLLPLFEEPSPTPEPARWPALGRNGGSRRTSCGPWIHVTGAAATHDQLLWGPPGPDHDRRPAVSCRHLSACRSARSWATSLLAPSAITDRPNGAIRDARTGISASP